MAVKKAPDVVTANLTTGTLTSDSYLPPVDTRILARVRGTFVGNARLQASYDAGANWDDIVVFAAPDMIVFKPAGLPLLRFDMSGGGDYTSGTAAIFIGF